MIGVAFGLGFILGPGIGGPLGDIDVRLPFWVAAGFSLANWLYGYFFVPESLRDEHRKEFTLRRANPIGSLVLLRSHPELWKLASLQFLAYVSHEVFVIWALYAIYRFAWSQTMIGVSLAVVGIFTAAISGGLTGRIVAWLGEKRTLYIGQFFGAVGMVIAGLARSSLVYIASIPVISMWNISFPAAQGMMTHRVSEREQGELQGAIQSLRSIAFVIGPFLFSGIFAWFIDPKRSFHIPGAPYYFAAALLFTAMLLALRVQQPQFDQPGSKPIDPSEVVPPGGIAPGEIAPIANPTQENI
jgi:DHA1 family tetracycline resistance protein-like MFS transporter